VREWRRRARCSWALPHGEVPDCPKHRVIMEVVHQFGAPAGQTIDVGSQSRPVPFWRGGFADGVAIAPGRLLVQARS
jgi:hypothetical protein